MTSVLVSSFERTRRHVLHCHNTRAGYSFPILYFMEHGHEKMIRVLKLKWLFSIVLDHSFDAFEYFFQSLFFHIKSSTRIPLVVL